MATKSSGKCGYGSKGVDDIAGEPQPEDMKQSNTADTSRSNIVRKIDFGSSKTLKAMTASKMINARITLCTVNFARNNSTKHKQSKIILRNCFRNYLVKLFIEGAISHKKAECGLCGAKIETFSNLKLNEIKRYSVFWRPEVIKATITIYNESHEQLTKPFLNSFLEENNIDDVKPTAGSNFHGKKSETRETLEFTNKENFLCLSNL